MLICQLLFYRLVFALYSFELSEVRALFCRPHNQIEELIYKIEANCIVARLIEQINVGGGVNKITMFNADLLRQQLCRRNG
jgi:hypothetical protein